MSMKSHLLSYHNTRATRNLSNFDWIFTNLKHIFFFFALLGKRWNSSLLSIVTKLKSQNMTFDEVQDPI